MTENNQNQSKNRLAEERTDLADRRTTYARTRTFQAAERTYSAWVRTGFPIAGAGVTLGRALRSSSGETAALTIGGILVFLGMLTFCYAWFEYKMTYDYIKSMPSGSEDTEQNFRLNFIIVSLITFILLGASILGFLFMFF